jgi:hypothetical protein
MWLFLRIQQNLNHKGYNDAIHGWMTGQMDKMDGKLHEKRPRHLLIYVIITHFDYYFYGMLEFHC